MWPAASQPGGLALQQSERRWNEREVGAAPAASVGYLNQVIRRDPGELDAELAEISGRLLPNVHDPAGLLHVLAKD
jgi:hypothetical protein